MPELPEVETVVRTIRPRIVGRTIVGVRVGRKKLRQPWSRNWTMTIKGRRIESVRRRGKWIIIQLDAGSLLAHLGMSGQLTVTPSNQAKRPHTHVIFDFGDDQLRFRDARRFGCIQYFDHVQPLTEYLNARLGSEPFDIDPRQWRESLEKSRRPIKAALLDQSVVAGIGNIYADESLFMARIHPATDTNAMTARQANALRAAMGKVLTLAINGRGSSIRDYLDGAGSPGEYQSCFRVYGRFGKPCQRCRTPIERIRLAGRSTHFCPNCQKKN